MCIQNSVESSKLNFFSEKMKFSKKYVKSFFSYVKAFSFIMEFPSPSTMNHSRASLTVAILVIFWVPRGLWARGYVRAFDCLSVLVCIFKSRVSFCRLSFYLTELLRTTSGAVYVTRQSLQEIRQCSHHLSLHQPSPRSIDASRYLADGN